MIIEAELEISDHIIEAEFGVVQIASDGGYERGYAEGEAAGYEKGHTAGVADGIEQGRQAAIPEETILATTAIGSIIFVNDVSEIPHTCSITGAEGTTVWVGGKNILRLTGREEVIDNTITPQNRSFNGNGIFLGITKDNYMCSTCIKSYSITDTGIKFVSNNTAYGIGFDIRVEPEKMLTIQNMDSTHTINVAFYQEDGTYISGESGTGSLIVTTPYNAAWAIFIMAPGVSAKVNVELEYADLQVESGTAVTAYEPCAGAFYDIGSTEKIEFDSFSPTMTVFSTDGSTIEFGYNKSYGAQIAYDRFWDVFQQSGNRTNYDNAFYGVGWTDETYKPKYIPKPVGQATRMFDGALVTRIDLTNLDTTELTAGGTSMFGGSKVVYLEMDIPKCTGLASSIYYLRQMRTLKLHDMNQCHLGALIHAFALENVEFGGTFGGAYFEAASSSLLTYESLQNIIEAAYDYAADPDGSTHTIKFHATPKALLTEADIAKLTEKGWTLT